MRRTVFSLLLWVLVCAFSTYSQNVVEAESSVKLGEKSAEVALVIQNDSRGFDATIALELIDTAGNIHTTATKGEVVDEGKRAYTIEVPLGVLSRTTADDIAWYRLRYRVGDVSGIVAMSQLIKDLFEIKIIASDMVMSGMTHRTRVRAVNQFDGKPVAGVMVTTVLEIDLRDSAGKFRLQNSSVTDGDGFAVIDLAIPPETKLDEDGEIKIVASKNGIVREVTENLNAAANDVQMLMMTDKPIYQPEQLVSIRGILLKGGEGKTILSGEELEFVIKDEDDTLLYREKVSSSEFGIAALSWRIPTNAKLGEYTIVVRDARGDQLGGRRIKVSRYDLPNFVVTAKPQKAYYLPGEDRAEVEVRADYLFGKPVTKGKVRVVEETSREWNWREQKYDIDEGQISEGETDGEGKFIAKFDLKEEHEEIEEDSWRKYRDINFAAHFTDPTTNKTEQRRFDIRVTREPIHVYLIGETYGLNPNLPINAYVSTFYADGTPAECDVEIKASIEDADKFKSVGRTKTNSYGAGRMRMMRPKIGDPDDDLDFVLIAKDKSGRRGMYGNDINFDDGDNELQITTDAAIYKPGDTIKVAVNSTLDNAPVYIDVVNGWSVIDSHFAVLKNGKAEVRIPYNDAFKGELKIAAFAEDDDDDLVKASRGVIFPATQNIKVDATFDKAVYKPNDEATVSFGIVDALGRAAKSALGIVILDKAVEERARTDSEFGNIWRDYSGLLGYGDGFGSVNVKDLNELDLTKPISDEMQLVADVILHDAYYSPNMFYSRRYESEAKSVFAAEIAKQFERVGDILSKGFAERAYLHAIDEARLRDVLGAGGIDFDKLRDPWGMAYRTTFSVEKNRDIVTISSNGADKQVGTKDDFTAFTAGFEYFTPIGKAVDTVVRNYYLRTGGFIRDEKTLFAELGMRELSDRFGRPYRFIFEGDARYLKIRIRSAGPDGKVETYDWSGDDFDVWTNRSDYFAGTEQRISDIQRKLATIPLNEVAFKESLKSGGVDFDSLRDGHGNPLYVVAIQTSRYWERVTFETVQIFGDKKTTERRIITPVTQQVIQFTIRSSGSDGKQGTYDDVTLTQVVHVLAEQTKDDPKPVSIIRPISYVATNGSIAGVVTDANGAIIAGATVTATNDATSVQKSATTNDEGQYLITNLAAGTYSIHFAARGFKDTVLSSVPVKANTTVQANVSLSSGTVSENVTVSSDVELINTTNASVSVNGARQISSLPINTRSALSLMKLKPGMTNEWEKSTPRVREYFPETLLWQPEVITDDDGKAQIKFRMADNITTWKMYTIASTKSGKIGVAEKEVTAFQAFFVDLDPPKFLTEGDEIYLPTQVRNYTDKKQRVDVAMEKAGWFSLLAADKQQIDVAAGETENAVFGFKTVTPVKDGKQRVTAIAQTDSDAIEKPVTVRPNGEEVVKTDSRYFTGSESFEIDFPSNALQKTQKAELKIYPNLYSHIADSIEGLLQRPYGCGEQTISSTYPNLMILKFARPDSAIAGKAKRYLQKGYERLVGYQVADGGFTYWGGKDTSDVALTAYALRFLNDASEKIEVDADVIKRAEDWLIKQQRADGSWAKLYRWETAEDAKRTKLTTTYVARSLAMRKNSDKDALTRALAFLKTKNAEIDDPYAMALFGLAALDAGDATTATLLAKRLEQTAKVEGNGVYWNLESNTPFYGWGTAGRIETTALVTQLLIKLQIAERQKTNGSDLISKAMLFLLKNKDRYGVWHSTQTTINVLDAFVVAMAENRIREDQTLQILINGEHFQNIAVAKDKIDPIFIDLTAKLNAANNKIDVRSENSAAMMSQVVATHYIDWADSIASDRTVNQSRALKLDYKCDKLSASIMEEVTCSVSTERVGFRGYGMLLAEIGTPPGADVSRESLERAIEADWSISRYDILPDRIIVYMWAKAGGTNFDFKFRSRYGINARTPPSVVYDYYNPEAQATLAPLRFAVK